MGPVFSITIWPASFFYKGLKVIHIFLTQNPTPPAATTNPYHPAKAVGVPGATGTNIGSKTYPAGKSE